MEPIFVFDETICILAATEQDKVFSFDERESVFVVD